MQERFGGTLKSSTYSTVATVFKKLISQSLADRLTVKRKYTINSNGSVQRWWYVVRGEELDLYSRVGKNMGSYCNTNKLEIGASFQV